MPNYDCNQPHSNGSFYFVDQLGIEPSTYWLWVSCSNRVSYKSKGAGGRTGYLHGGPFGDPTFLELQYVSIGAHPSFRHSSMFLSVGIDGLEPPNSKRADLQSAAIATMRYPNFSTSFLSCQCEPFTVTKERFELSRLSTLVPKTSVAPITPLGHFCADGELRYLNLLINSQLLCRWATSACCWECRIRTYGLLVPNQARYRTTLIPKIKIMLEYPSRSNLKCLIVVLRALGTGCCLLK